MSLFDAAVLVALVLGVTWYVVRYERETIAQLSDSITIRRRTAVLAYVVWLVGLVVPVLLGASFGDAGLGYTLATVGYSVGLFLLTVALSSRQERRLVESLEPVGPDGVTVGPGDDPVLTSGNPIAADADPLTTPVSGVPVVSHRWLVQAPERVGLRTVETNLAAGRESVPFVVEGTTQDVRVDPVPDRTYETETSWLTLAADDDLSGRTRAWLRDHPDLPDPDERDDDLTVVEEFVPLDAPVTVVGFPERGPDGDVRVTSGPDVDFDAGGVVLDGTGPAPEESGGPLLVPGDVATVRRKLFRRVYWAGAAGAVGTAFGAAGMVWFSAATLPGLPLVASSVPPALPLP